MEGKFIEHRKSQENKPGVTGVLEELQWLSRIESPSKFEGGIRNYLKKKLEGYDIATEVDDKGNLWGHSNAPEGEVLLSAHMDKIGRGSSLQMEGNKVIGRLDDALGLSVIMGIFRQGLRPSVLFTVEEESTRQVMKNDGTAKYSTRSLAGGIHNAGARRAAERLYAQEVEKPKLIIFLDTSANSIIGKGALVAKTSFDFMFPVETAKDIFKILKGEGISVRYWDANATDAIEGTFLKNQPMTLIEVPAEHYHTDHETADARDIADAFAVVEALIHNRDKINPSPNSPIQFNPNRRQIDL